MTPIRNTKLLGPYDEKAELSKDFERCTHFILELCLVILGGSRESLVMLVWFKALLHLKSLDGVKMSRMWRQSVVKKTTKEINYFQLINFEKHKNKSRQAGGDSVC